MTTIRILRDQAVPPGMTLDQVQEEYPLASNDDALAPGTVVRNVAIRYGGVAVFAHPENGYPYYSEPEDYIILPIDEEELFS